MGTGVDDDIKRDFLQEAGELVQRLSEQLIDLEKTPDDPELLNAVFRAFHTVKGGAGFLELHPLVALCHVTEDVCNGLRSGQVKLDSTMMDCLLQSLDQVQLMLDAVA
ncbi:MAG TPA: Hpt domain-containing protein, partial [Solimonas sp.]